MNQALANVLRWFGTALYGIGLARGVRWLNRREPKVLLYHGCEEGESDFTRGLGGNTSPAQLARHLDFLCRYYRIIPLDKLLRNGTPDRAVVLTFDDGYRSVYVNAFPLLKARGLPATIYLVTDVVGNKAMVWVNELNWLLRRYPTVVRPIVTKAFGLAEHASAEQVMRYACQYADPLQVSRLLEHLRAAAGVDLQALCREARLYVSWEEVLAMAQHGVSFGNHTATHANLSRLGDEGRQAEIGQAQAALTAQVGKCDSFAYPFGIYDAACRRQAVQHGYTWILGVGSVNRPFDPEHIGRAQLRGRTDAEIFAELEIVWPVMGRLKRVVRRLAPRGWDG
jgi:peptidoglycan/xylan/chitin deacetylase (PgdA/CDA1 family)